MSRRTVVLRRVLANPRLRRLALAFLGFSVAEYGVWVAALVYAYEHGGTTAAALVAVLQLLPAAVVAPVAAGYTDRRGGASVLRIGYIVQALGMGVGAASLWLGAPPAAVYAGAVVAASAVTLTRPAQGALLPEFVDRPGELVAANVVIGWVESVSLLVGPALAGGLIALDGPAAAFAAFAAAVTTSAILVAELGDRSGRRDIDHPAQQRRPVQMTVASVLRAEPRVTLLVTVIAMQFVAMGALDVLEVVLALKVLALGPSGAGFLGAAFGAGAVIGGIGALALVGRHRLVGPLLGAGIGWGVSFVALGVWPSVAGAFALLAGAGASHAVLDISGRTIMHRVVPAQAHGRLFGILECLTMLGLAVGSIAVPLLVDLGGAEAALIGVGGLLVLVAFASVAALRALERSMPAPDLELTLLTQSRLFSMLPAPALEDLAQALVPETVLAGEVVVQEGETGDRFYLIATGTLEVSVRGAVVRTLVAGDGFGEIALLRDGVRTATVTATVPAMLYALERPPFLQAVTGSPHVHQAAEDLVSRRLASPPV